MIDSGERRPEQRGGTIRLGFSIKEGALKMIKMPALAASIALVFGTYSVALLPGSKTRHVR
jgi:hypothetical protein